MGIPILEGYWTNDTYTPLERPAEFRDKEFFTHDEAMAFVKDQNDRVLGQPKDNIHYDDAIWQTENYGKFENLRTSLIVEPQNGLLPPLTPEAQRRLPQQRATQRGLSFDSAESRSLGERCITWGNVGPPMLPPTYYANLQILQASDQLIIRHELMDALRIIHWFSLIDLPPESAFPGTGPEANGIGTRMKTQHDWINAMKGGCSACHQLGLKALREIPSALGKFPSNLAAWERRLQVGQDAPSMISGIDSMGRARAIELFARWTDRIEAGALPPVPPAAAGNRAQRRAHDVGLGRSGNVRPRRAHDR